MDFTQEMKKVLLAGIGAVACTAEKASSLVVKEEPAEPSAQDILNNLDKLTPQEREELKNKLSEMEKTDECECADDEE